jgi:hypothetical protein
LKYWARRGTADRSITVRVYGDYLGYSAVLEESYYGFYAEGFAWDEAFVLAAVGKVGQNRGYSASFHVFCVVGHEH